MVAEIVDFDYDVSLELICFLFILSGYVCGFNLGVFCVGGLVLNCCESFGGFSYVWIVLVCLFVGLGLVVMYGSGCSYDLTCWVVNMFVIVVRSFGCELCCFLDSCVVGLWLGGCCFGFMLACGRFLCVCFAFRYS